MKTVTANADIRQAVSKDVRGLDSKLGLFMYNIRADLDKLRSIGKKTGRKSKIPDPS